MSEFLVTPHERVGNALWVRLTVHLRDRLHSLRCQNDGPQDPAETARLRGAIAEVKRLLDANEDRPIVEPDKNEQF